MILSGDRVYNVDWPQARIGAAWIDLAGIARDIALHGGEPEGFFQRSTAGQDPDPRHVNAVLAAIAGYLTSQALKPEPPGLPGIRAFQAAGGVAARQWLAARTG